jgi:hypothetical protein
MGRPKTEAADYKSHLLRLPETMLEACKARANKERRSLNAQLLTMIDDWLQTTQQPMQHDLVGPREH